ncbi:MAG: beta-galactosidase [Erysipelotrichaceae bacterium]|nr:beta-galactosidase [Erysipelotrichaceae bacterium]
MRYLGVDYYPEQWGMELVDQDLSDIVSLGANLIRIGDFAWDRFEPTEGEYDFSFFDEVIAKAEKHRLKVMMCVPTATMPSWLYERYPEVMNVDEKGYAQPYGARRGCCYGNELYIRKAVSLAEKLAEHYKDCETIVAWQVDNEIGHEGSDVCFCKNCEKRFVSYLREKYKDIDELNRRWGTAFWSQTYGDFKQIPLPRPGFTPHNPSLRLEYARFRDQVAADYIKALVDAVKRFDQKHPVTHDFEGGIINKSFSPFHAAEALDFVSYNNYPVWGGQKAPLSEAELAFSVDFARGFKGEKFWVTESIMGQQGHNDIGYAPKPGEAENWALSSLDQGVESLIFFRYRGFTKGAEQFCFGILDADNQKRRKYFETMDFFKKAKLKPVVEPKGEVCIVYDYDSKSSMSIQRQSDVFSYEKECIKFYTQFYKRGTVCDIVDSSRDLSGYKIAVLPYMIIMSDAFKKRLKDYAANGGIVILTPRSAWKDTDNNLIFGKRMPVDLDDLCGCVIEEHESLLQGQSAPCEYRGKEGRGSVFEELLKLTGGDMLVSWKDNPYGAYAAAVEHRYGKGWSYYLGTSFDEDTLTALFDHILEKLG